MGSENILDGVRRNVKHAATRVADYETLRVFVRTWAIGEGHRFLVILGRPGIMKSSSVKAVFARESQRLWVEGDTGPLALYRDLFLSANKPTILDDVPLNERIRSILQSLTDNYELCRVRWASAKPLKVRMSGEAEEEKAENEEGLECSESEIVTLPTSFDTSSPVCVITNSIDRLSTMVGLLDRAYIIEFDPSVSDVLEECQAFVHPTIWAWAKQHERLLPDLSVRDLVQAGKNLQIRLPWEKLLRDMYLDPRSKLGAYLSVVDDPRYRTAADKQERFEAMTGLERRAYYRVQEEYRKMFPSKNLPRGRAALKTKSR